MDEIVYRLIGDRLKKIRTKRTLTQGDIAAIIDSSKASVVNYEKGNQAIYLSDLYKIALKLDIDIKQFLPTNTEVKEALPNQVIKKSNLPEKEKAALIKFIESKKSNK